MQKIIYPNDLFLREVEKAGPFQTQACFQCRKCGSGCPVAFALDLFPDEVIRLVSLGRQEEVLSCRTIWVCSGCETCTSRCPNEVRIAELMDYLKERAVREKAPCPEPRVLSLQQTFLENVRKYGRVFETTLLPAYWLRSGRLWKKWKEGTIPAEIRLGVKMFFKGRVSLWPGKHKGRLKDE
jgi:heterodisulfide reductase subunit C